MENKIPRTFLESLAKHHFAMFGFIAGALFSFVAAVNTIANTPVPVVAPPTLPARIDVNGVAFTTERKSKDDIQDMPALTLGYTDCLRHRIYIRMGFDDRETLMHELDHAMVCYFGPSGPTALNLYYNSSDNEAHEGIYRHAYLWRELYKRNPGLGAYLGGQ